MCFYFLLILMYFTGFLQDFFVFHLNNWCMVIIIHGYLSEASYYNFVGTIAFTETDDLMSKLNCICKLKP